jgi:hypothetical protein
LGSSSPRKHLSSPSPSLSPARLPSRDEQGVLPHFLEIDLGGIAAGVSASFYSRSSSSRNKEAFWGSSAGFPPFGFSIEPISVLPSTEIVHLALTVSESRENSAVMGLFVHLFLSFLFLLFDLLFVAGGSIEFFLAPLKMSC